MENGTRPLLKNLAQRIEPSASWNDLVLPDAQRTVLGRFLLLARARSSI